jgi:hypothetical protein
MRLQTIRQRRLWCAPGGLADWHSGAGRTWGGEAAAQGVRVRHAHAWAWLLLMLNRTAFLPCCHFSFVEPGQVQAPSQQIRPI